MCLSSLGQKNCPKSQDKIMDTEIGGDGDGEYGMEICSSTSSLMVVIISQLIHFIHYIIVVTNLPGH